MHLLLLTILKFQKSWQINARGKFRDRFVLSSHNSNNSRSARTRSIRDHRNLVNAKDARLVVFLATGKSEKLPRICKILPNKVCCYNFFYQLVLQFGNNFILEKILAAYDRFNRSRRSKTV